jgi:sugar lactone lactonase YvrE
MPKYDNGTPTRLLFDSSDPSTTTLLVVDTHNSRIMRYSLGGALLQQFGKYGTAPDEMIFPTDIAVDTSVTMYIAEYQDRHDRVMVYSRAGKFIRQFGDFGEEPGKFQRPEGIVFIAPNRLIVADTCNDRLQVFDLSGKLIEVWGSVGKAPGQFNYPYDLAVDKQGRVYVADFGNNRIQVLDRTGRSIAIFGGPGKDPGQLGNPWGVALTAAGDQVWVADTQNHRLQKFDVQKTIKPLIAMKHRVGE